jgi:protein-S-isoprenylcysteine O-methyltransferase Ste14
MVILAISFIINMLLINISPSVVKELVVVGYVILGIGVFLFMLSMITLRTKGIRQLIDSGIYGIVRHPMYLGGMIMFLSHVFFGQNWIVLLSTIVGIKCCYILMRSGDQRNINKFGEGYVKYMKRVPRMNFVSGLVRLIRKAD